MNHPIRSLRAWAPAAALLLFVFVAGTAACGRDRSPHSPDLPPETTPDPTPEPTPTATSRYTLAAAVEAAGAPLETTAQSRRAVLYDRTRAAQEQSSGVFVGVLTNDSASSSFTEPIGGPADFMYDAYVITARESGTVTIRSDVISANPDGYPYGYGFPLSMAELESGGSLQGYGANYAQNAINSGTAIVNYCVGAGRQYILVYKTFRKFVPLTYQLTLPATLTVEGRIDALPTAVPVPEISAGRITLANPRPDVLNRLVPTLDSRVNDSPLPASCPVTVPLGLTAATPDPGASPPPDQQALRGAVTADSALGVNSLRDAHIVTALASGMVTIRSDVIDAGPGRYGYGWPLVIAPIIDGEAPDFVLPDRVVQDARGTGTEIIEHSVTEGRQYVLLYLATSWDVPIEYRLTLPSALRVEGRVYRLEDPLSVPSSGTGMITLENPRADWLTNYLSPLMD